MRLIVFAALLFGNLAAIAQAPTPRVVQNIETFARLYGYVRYFHPSDEAAAVDWDKLAVLGAQHVDAAKTDNELRTTLLTLFRPVAPTLQLLPINKKVSFAAKEITPNDLKGYQVISWQHYGMGQGNARSIYHSRRLHRPEALKSAEPTFGTLTKAVDATAYRGKEFRYTAFVRNATPEQGSGALWARVDLPGRKMGFFDNMNDRPITRGEWTEYEIKGTIDPQAVSLYFGAMLSGRGQVQVDKMQVLVREADTWKTVFATDFETDAVDKYPESISGKANAKSYTKEYSFAVSEKSAAEGRRSVLISSSSSESETANGSDEALFARQVAIGEVVQENIGSGLRCVLPLALYGTKEATYPAADKAELTALQAALKQLPAADLTSKSRALRLADVVITWNVFQHFYPYFAFSKSDWPAALPEALRAAYPDQTDAEYLKTLRRLTARLHDGHVGVYSYGRATNVKYLPVAWEWVQNQLMITQVADNSLAVHKDDIVTTINGQPAAAYFREAEQYISAATQGWLRYRAASETASGPAGSALQVEVLRPGASATAVTLHFDQTTNQYSATRQGSASRRLSPSVYYLNLDQIPMDSIDKLMPELEKSKAIICNLRGYPKSNHGLLAHLLSQPDTAGHWMRVPHYIYPDQKQLAGYTPMGWKLKPKAPHLSARIIFITDGSAISYAESFMGFVEGYKLATIIGQPTAGTNGNINPFTLPGNYRISWTGMEVRKHNGSQHHGVGIIPNIYLEKTIQGVREGRDEFLEKAIELANAQ
ncbi:S41 family peptidase [Hymenobacter volaticus]|uniref:S41 family peptidase n=1 Tax=Hymenobacter volaticus TaxID=2932254 RepID=A0ABY4G656_9BACT|nr:S41 family peptidase [Hymenobacter volaticus]UOQ66332.1 S41 family peptidase [Hymenobacter volaticus]